MLHDVLAFRRHARVQLERLKINFNGDLIAQFLKRLLQCAQANGTPGASYVGNKINFQWIGHALHDALLVNE